MDMIAGMTPMPLQGLTNKFTSSGQTDPLNWWDHVVGSFGFPVHRASPTADVHQEAKNWQQTNFPATVDKGSFAPSKYTNLRYALEDNDQKRAVAEVQKLIDAGMTQEKIDSGFKESLTRPYTNSHEMDKLFRDSLSEKGRARLEKARTWKATVMSRYDDMIGMKRSGVTESTLEKIGQ